MELTCGAETLEGIPIKRGKFQGDALLPLLFVIAVIPLTHILRTANPGHEFLIGEIINHLLFMDDLMLYAKSKRVLDSLVQTVRISSEDKKGKKLKSDGI